MCEYVRLPDVDEVEVCCRRFPPLWTTSSSRLVLAIEQRTFITTLLPGTAGSGVCPGAWLPLASVIFVTKSIIRAISTLKEVLKKTSKTWFYKLPAAIFSQTNNRFIQKVLKIFKNLENKIPKISRMSKMFEQMFKNSIENLKN